MKYAWIAKHCGSYSVSVLCEVLGVSKSGYYAWLDRPRSSRALRRERIDAAVRQVYAASHGIYGSRKIAKELAQCEELETACRNTVAQAMREMGLKSRVSKTFRPTTTQTDPTKRPAPKRARSRLYGDQAKPEVGHGHHLPADACRLGLSGRGARLVQPQGRRLGDQRFVGDAPGRRSLAASTWKSSTIPCGYTSRSDSKVQTSSKPITPRS